MDAAGKISGEVAADSAGEYEFTVMATDKANSSLKDTQKLTLVINEKLAITTSLLPTGIVGQVYDSDNATMAAIGGSGDYTWEVTAGTLPDNLTLSDEGVISGTPGAVGSSTITITVTDSSSPAQTANKEFTITVNAAP